MPLFNGYFESILAQPLNSTNELTQRAVTLLVEPAVVEKLVECLLFASLEHPLEREEHNFSDQEFVVVSVVAHHGGLFNGNFGYAVVVSAFQMLELDVELISLVLELLRNLVHFVDVSVVVYPVAF